MKEEEEEEEEEEEDMVSDGAEGGVVELQEGLEGELAEECGLGEEGEEEEGEEGELEPAASESEDGCSMHTASSSLQLHAMADSIPSSPASSQL